MWGLTTIVVMTLCAFDKTVSESSRQHSSNPLDWLRVKGINFNLISTNLKHKVGYSEMCDLVSQSSLAPIQVGWTNRLPASLGL